MKMKLSLAGLAAITAGTLVAVPDYQNDFTTRTSGPVQTGAWYTNTYVVGTCAKNIADKVPSPEEPFDTANAVQDNWMKLAQSGNAQSCVSSIVNDSDNVVSDNQNFRFGNSVDVVKKVGVAQSFYNSFSNGIVRISADLRAPTSWPSGSGFIRVQPLYRAALETPVWADGSKQVRTFMNFGIQKRTDSQTASRLIVYKGNKSGTGSISESWSHTNKNWYRFVIDLNLDEGTYSGVVYNQGTTHPNLSDANGTQVWSVSAVDSVWSYQNAGCGPLEGIAIRAADFKTASPVDRYLDPSVDNLVAEWKAPGTSEFVRFYENDFTTRRYRTVCPAPTTRHDYVRDAALTEVTTSPYASIMGGTVTNLSNQVILSNKDRGLGVNGWKRANEAGTSAMDIVKYDANNAMMRASGSASFVIATQTLGESVASGKVRMAFDFRTPDEWHSHNHGAYALMGNKNYWGVSNAGYTANYGTRLGLATAANAAVDKFYATYQDNDAKYDTTASFKALTWYRGIMTADLTTRQVSYTLYELGDAPKADNFDHTTLTPVWTKTGAMKADVTEISSIGLAAYGAGGRQTSGVVHREYIFFDNVQVWKDWDDGTQKGKLLYKDDFTTVTRGFAQQNRGQLIGSFHTDDGQDHWIRRNSGTGDVWITGGANPCVAVSGNATHAYAVQSLGARYVADKVTVQCDMRPPNAFTLQNGRAALVSVGGDKFLRGNVGSQANEAFTGGIYGYFGFCNDSNGSEGQGLYRTKKLRFLNGNGAGGGSVLDRAVTIKDDHWYRFKAVFNQKTRTYDVTVYDQGTEHPTLATPNGTKIHTETGIPFRAPTTEKGVAAIGLSSYGTTPVVSCDPEDPGLALYDNLKVSSPKGLAILVR